jgi:hypothetical protein
VSKNPVNLTGVCILEEVRNHFLFIDWLADHLKHLDNSGSDWSQFVATH